MVAGRARAIYDQQAKERQQDAGKIHGRGKVVANFPQPNDSSRSRDAAGRAVGVSGKSVDYATRVLANAEPEVIAAVDAGRMAVSSAAVISGDSREEQLAELKKNKNRVYTSTKQTTDAKPEPEKEPTAKTV